MKEYIDNLTGLNNMLFLFQNYNNYIEKNPNTYMVSVDFQKLKYVNDNFGHAVGDVCIMTFSNLIKYYFSDSLLIRRSGDEFLLITSKKVEEIISKFSDVEKGIELAFQKDILPIAFKFNCGIKKSDSDLKETLYKADITMYKAKEASKLLEYYQEEFLTDIRDKEHFIKKFDKLIEDNSFTYAKQYVYDLNAKNSGVFEIYTRDENLDSILCNANMEILKANYRIKKLDLLNLDNLFSSQLLKNENYIININFLTIISHEYSFIEELTKKIEKYDLNPSKICISIDSFDTAHSLDRIIDNIKGFKKLGFKVAIQGISFDNKFCTLPLIATLNIDYVKLNRDVLRRAMSDTKVKIVLMYIVKMLISLSIKPLFVNVETVEEIEFLESIDSRCLMKGLYFGELIKLEL